jgi:hypothetical protein
MGVFMVFKFTHSSIFFVPLKVNQCDLQMWFTTSLYHCCVGPAVILDYDLFGSE